MFLGCKQLIALLFIFALRVDAILAADDYVVVINAKNSVQQVTAHQVKDFYYGRTAFWESGSKVRPALLDQKSPATLAFFGSLLNTEPGSFSAFWRRRLFSGRGVPPRQFSSERELLEFVSQTEGAIAVIEKAPTGDLASLLKVIPVTQ